MPLPWDTSKLPVRRSRTDKCACACFDYCSYIRFSREIKVEEKCWICEFLFEESFWNRVYQRRQRDRWIEGIDWNESVGWLSTSVYLSSFSHFFHLSPLVSYSSSLSGSGARTRSPSLTLTCENLEHPFGSRGTVHRRATHANSPIEMASLGCVGLAGTWRVSGVPQISERKRKGIRAERTQVFLLFRF